MAHSIPSVGLRIMPPDDPEPFIQELHCAEVERKKLTINPNDTQINMRVEFGGRSYDFYVIVLTAEYMLRRNLSYRRRPFELLMLPQGGIVLLSLQLSFGDTTRTKIFTLV